MQKEHLAKIYIAITASIRSSNRRFLFYSKKTQRRNVIKTFHLFDRHVVLVISPLPDDFINGSNDVIVNVDTRTRGRAGRVHAQSTVSGRPPHAHEPSCCSSSSNSKGTMPDMLLSLLGASNKDAILCWISLLILPEPALIPSPNPAGNRAPERLGL